MPHVPTETSVPAIAVGPRFPGWGSWEWIGADFERHLAESFTTSVFGWHKLPEGDAAIVVKHPLPIEWWLESTRRPPVIYCPVDRYGSATEIDADGGWLSRCARIVVHCERLRKYFAPYAPVEYLDHAIKFAGRPQPAHVPAGPVFWVGVRTNLPPLVEWVNAHGLPRPLIVLTNPELPALPMDAREYGFRPELDVRMGVWTAERHLELLPQVSAAIDIKGSGFRAAHKPPAKALDFIAAGVPLATNADSSSAEHLARMGFETADPSDTDYWLSPDYWEETRRFGAAVSELLSLSRIARRSRRLVREVLAERPPAPPTRIRPIPAAAPSHDAKPERTEGSNGSRAVRVAILSLLFNWPSTGGGTVHTAELGKFLSRAGYEVQHIYAKFPEWGLGNVTQPTGVSSVPIAFDAASWNAASIKRRFRQAVEDFQPDYVIVTDSWTSKPVLAEAVEAYRYYLRLAALECLCPLNNVRLLFEADCQIKSCPRQQLADASVCRNCVAQRGHQSGSLHQAERALAGFGEPDYSARLHKAFAEAEGILVVNPQIARMVAPFAKEVHVVPSGFDPARFPWPWPDSCGRPSDRADSSDSGCGPSLCGCGRSPCGCGRSRAPSRTAMIRAIPSDRTSPTPSSCSCGRSPDRATPSDRRSPTPSTSSCPMRLFFASLVHEPMKGFAVLHEACSRLWRRRHDFELVATADPRGQIDAFTHCVGWLSQAELPRQLRDVDMLVFPTIAEEALGRSAVEAMGVGRPVIASRIGGLPYTVLDGTTGLLFEPGNADDLAAKIAMLLDDEALRSRLGEAGRRRFEEEFTWEVIIEKHYRHLLKLPRSDPGKRHRVSVPLLGSQMSASSIREV